MSVVQTELLISSKYTSEALHANSIFGKVLLFTHEQLNPVGKQLQCVS